MKKHILNLLAMLSLFAALTLPSLADTSEKMKVNIPFAFSIGKTTFQAGHYSVSADIPHGTVTFTRLDTNASAYALVSVFSQASGNQSQPVFRFRRYGERYFLFEVRGMATAGQFYTSGAERALEKELRHLAKRAVAPEIVTVGIE